MNDFRPTDFPFCCLPPERLLESNARALAVADAWPLSAGHTLLIPRRHPPTFLEFTEDEIAAVHDLLRRMKDRLDATLKPGRYTLGINLGADSGQTVAHLDVHLIPRYPGDAADSVGGVRTVSSGRYPATGSSSRTIRG